MPIPDYQVAMLPLLRLAADGAEHRFRDAVDKLSQEFSLTDAERSEMLPRGNELLFNNRVAWAKTYLKQAGALSSPKYGFFCITERGKQLLAKKPQQIDNNLLMQFEEFRVFRAKRRKSTSNSAMPEMPASENELISAQTPEDQLANAYNQLRQDLELNLIDQVKGISAAFFERLVIDLLISMGYGGSRRDAGRAIGKSGDGGIDGIIKEDKLGLDVIYVQAKRWEGTVGRPEIQKFAGALQGRRASKGVFITTSSYSKEALDYVNTLNIKIILIDGQLLANLMVDHNVGVSTVGMYEVKKIDADYFEGE